MSIGEVFLGAVLGVLFQKLASPELLKYARRLNIHKQLNKWSQMLSTIKAVIIDAEEKQITEEAVKVWLNRLQDLADDLENMVEELAYQALKRRLMAGSSTSKLRKLIIPTCCTSFTPHAVMFDFKMNPKIRDITARLEDLAYQKNNLQLTEQVGGRRLKIDEERRPTIDTPAAEETQSSNKCASQKNKSWKTTTTQHLHPTGS